MKNVIRWVVYGAALAAGLLAARTWSVVAPANGGASATMLANDSIPIAIGLTFLYFALAGAFGLLAAWLLGARSGLFCVGLALMGPTWAQGIPAEGTVENLVRFAQSGAPFRMLSVEGAVMALLGVGLAIPVVRAARRAGHDPAEAPTFAENLVAVVVTIIVGGVGAWIIAREGLRGQTFAAAAIAGLAGATVASVVSHRASPVAFVVGMGVLAVAGPVLGLVLNGQNAVAAAYANRLFPLAMITPMDWVAGALFGIPMGMAWGASMVEKRAPEAAPA